MSFKFRSITTLTALFLGTSILPASYASAQVLAQTDVIAKAKTQVPQVGSFEGMVREIFVNRFILESGDTRLLIEPRGVGSIFVLVPNERVTVIGTRYDTLIQATRIIRSTGEVLHETTLTSSPALVTPPPTESTTPQNTFRDGRVRNQPRAILDILSELSLQPLGEAVRKKHHTEILARMTDGRSVYVSFDLTGRLWEIEDAAHDRHSVAEAPKLRDAEILQRVIEAGFFPDPDEEIEQRKHHSVVTAKNKSGEAMYIHLDRRGYIFKQVWRF